MLFTKPIEEITFDDIVGFCNEEHLENEIIEYKRELPTNKDLAKSISAFANTHGGVLLIGVNAKDGKPTGPFNGFKLDPKVTYEEKIESVCLSNIKEPVFPEIKIPDPVKGRTFIVIRVAESELTPHRIADNTTVYVRTGQSSVPNDKADWGKIEWLLSRRNQSIALRERLLEEVQEYFERSFEVEKIDIKNKDGYFANLSIHTIPLFPQRQLVNYSSLANIGDKITVHRGGSKLPRNLYDPELIQEGVQKLHIPSGYREQGTPTPPFDYAYVNTYGIYAYKRDIGHTVKSEQKENPEFVKLIPFHLIVSTIHLFLISASQFYSTIGYFGSIRLEIQLKTTKDAKVVHPYAGFASGIEKFVPISKTYLTWEKIINAPLLREQSPKIGKGLLHEIGWSLNLRHLTQERIDKLSQNYTGNENG